VSVSIGGSMCGEMSDWAVWYSDADAALYEAKGRGGDGYHVAAQQPARCVV
jgi:GGDEF domain-containing protein